MVGFCGGSVLGFMRLAAVMRDLGVLAFGVANLDFLGGPVLRHHLVNVFRRILVTAGFILFVAHRLRIFLRRALVVSFHLLPVAERFSVFGLECHGQFSL